MATSQNGYRANDRSLIASYSIPGGKVALRKGDVATVLVYFAKRFHSEVEPLKWPGNWGYAERTIRGSSTTLSNHASGTAMDLNAPQHPLGRVGTFSSGQVRAIDRILADCDGVLRHGKNYNGRKDEMHVEINKGTAAVASLAKAIRAGKKPGPSGGATASPAGGGGAQYGDSNARHEVGSRVMRKYTSGTDVRWLQKRLYKLGHDLEFDGDFGPNVEKAVRAEQKKAGIAIDGEVYTDTIKALKAAKPVRGLPKGSSAAKPVGKVPGKKYAFPYESKGYIGPKSGPDWSHSGIGGRKTGGVLDRTLNKRFVNQLEERGWDPESDYLKKYGNDGKYGDELESLIRAFQKDQGLVVDGLAGKSTWNAAFKNPVT